MSVGQRQSDGQPVGAVTKDGKPFVLDIRKAARASGDAKAQEAVDKAGKKPMPVDPAAVLRAM